MTLVERAKGFQGQLRERAAEIETARRLPPDLARQFAEAGFMRQCVPSEYGGSETDPITLTRTIETLAEADAAAAWCVMIAATSGVTAAYMPPSVAREIYGDPLAITGGVFAPRGRAEADGNGYAVNGRWQWGSGTQNAQWVMGGCMVFENGQPKTFANGAPISRMMFVPAADVIFHDTWYVSGLRGTGSLDFEFKDRRVGRDYSVGLVGDTPLAKPLYAFPVFGLLAMGIVAVTFGLARAAIDELCLLAGAKTPTGQRRPLAMRAETQERVAEAEAILRSARGFLYDSIASAWEAARSTGEIPLDFRRDIRLAAAHGARSAARAVDMMYDLGGGTSVYETSRLQRCFRDVHTATQHMMVATPVLELAGRLFLGVEADVSTL